MEQFPRPNPPEREPMETVVVRLTEEDIFGPEGTEHPSEPMDADDF